MPASNALRRLSCSISLTIVSAFLLAVAQSQADDAIVPMPGPWKPAPTEAALLSGNGKPTIKRSGGWWEASAGGAYGLYPSTTSGVNQGIRAKFKYVKGGTADTAVRRWGNDKGVTHSYSLRLDENRMLKLVEFSKGADGNTERKSLLPAEKELQVQEGDEILFELVAIDDLLVAKINGQLLGTANGASTTPGKVHTYTTTMKTGGLEVLNLDGMEVKKARAALGLDKAAPNQPTAPPASSELPPPPVITGDADVVQRVTEIDGKFRALYDQLAGKAYKTGADHLKLSYLDALKREETKAQQKGSLKDVIVYQDEAKAITQGGAAEEVPPLVKPMHETYLKALAKLEADRQKFSTPAFEAYSKALDQYTAELTKGGRIEAAKQINGVNDAVKKAAPGKASKG